jgi:hypothetical protein
MTMSRSDAASVAANTRWAFEPDRAKATRPGTNAFLAKFERLVDPDGVLPAAERTKRARNALSAHMTRIRAKRRRHTTTRTT